MVLAFALPVLVSAGANAETALADTIPVRIAVTTSKSLAAPSPDESTAPTEAPQGTIRVLRAEPGAGEAPFGEPHAVDLPGAIELRLPQGEWWVLLDSPSFWARAARIKVGRQPASVALAAMPAGWIRGSLSPLEEGAALPAEIKLRFEASPGSSSRISGFQRCPIESGNFHCKLPAGTLDLRLRAEPFLTHYRWGLSVESGDRTRLGRLMLQRGASVVGWVLTEDGSPLGAEARVRLIPAGLATTLDGLRDPRSGLLERTAPVNDRGFFTLEAVEPGDYRLTASSPPLGEASADIRALPDLEAELREPLLLSSPAVLTAVIKPPLNPDGVPWTAVLKRRDPRRHRAEVVKQLEVNADGWLEIPGLARGSYNLSLLGAEGSPWLSRSFELGEQELPLELEIKLVRVRGSIQLGGEPLSAELWFGTRFGAEKVLLHSDEEGRFEGLLPRDGSWRVEVASAQPTLLVTLDDVSIELQEGQPTAEAHIELPDTAVDLLTVDAAGRPIAHAEVEAVPANHSLGGALAARTDNEGRTRLIGLPEGAYSLRAEASGGRASRHVPMEIREGGSGPPVVLTLRRHRAVMGAVVGPDGPVPGARVALYEPTPIADLSSVWTDARGVFEAEVPADAESVRYWLEAPGYAFQFGARPLPSSGTLDFELRREGGMLELSIEPGEPATPGGLYPALLHEGSFLGWGSLARRALPASEPGEAPARRRFADFAPGSYSLCWMTVEAGGEAVLESSCRHGLLLPGGRLELRLDRPASDR